METQLLKQEFNNHFVDFELTNDNVMINATQMAKVYGRKVEAFSRNLDVINFISECLKSENSRFLNVEKEEDLIISRQKSGTWMHRVLAIKFAAWLNPTFELWVYLTIDKILYDYYKRLEESLKVSAKRQNRISIIKEKLNSTAEFQELQRLELDERQESYKRAKENRNQLDMFRETTKE